MNEPLAAMFRYNKWANDQLIKCCAGLGDEQLNSRMPGVSDSIRTLLLHIVGGQQTFVLRTKGRQHEGEWNRASAWPGFDALSAIATASSNDLIGIASSLDADTDIELPWAGKFYRYPKSFFLLHALEHGVEHRTEIKVALAQLGIESPSLDAWDYAAAANVGGEA
jgi:uncharacterized damage-inducible protein DinB